MRIRAAIPVLKDYQVQANLVSYSNGKSRLPSSGHLDPSVFLEEKHTSCTRKVCFSLQCCSLMISRILLNNRFILCRPSLKQDVRYGKFNPATIGSSNLTGIANSSSSTGGSGGSTSFQDFQESVDDAWDSGDDEFCTVSDVKISKRVSHSAALSVINSHRSGNKCSQPSQANAKMMQQKIIPEEKKAEALQRLAVQPLHLRNVNLHPQMLNSQHSSEDADLKHSASPQHKPTQFPGRPQPLRQANAPNKFFIPSKEQGMYPFIHI